MTQPDKSDPQPSVQDVALIVGVARDQFELREAVCGERHACRHRGQESGQIGPALPSCVFRTISDSDSGRFRTP
jgi:hypothetical protein